ncbi:N-acetylmuramoyl-L-alanine amidase [Salipaludibacillus sp. HK11]|uniref:N-acetylmuramoyl-L-alanine amidase n=1 Tax=Salipaludibacillus sp. HK11 TaxID=3394320 RepID=UPI0039FCBE2C
MSNIKKVVMTRTNDTFIDLNRRSEIARQNNADVFVSVHLNAFNGTANGVETFKHNNSTASTPLATNVNNAMRSELSKLRSGTINNRGVKSANFSVLRNTYQSMLSILTEALFVDSSVDASVIKHKDFVNTTAQAIADGIRETIKSRKDVIVCIDAGHGGHDPGAVGNGLVEKDIALQISLQLRDILQGKRTSSTYTDVPNTFTNLSTSQKYAEIASATNAYNLQNLLIAAGFPLPKFGADGKPGAETLSAIQSFQSTYDISSPSGNNYGRSGPKTMEKLRSIVEYGGVRRVSRTGYAKGNDVKAIQRVLGVTDDSIYGPVTANAVKRYQTTNGLQSDAVVGPETWSHMFG